jgi:hypothetical protein
MRAIIVYFHIPHGTTKDEVLCLRPDLKKVIGVLIEPFSAQRTSDPGDGFRANLVEPSPLPIESQIAWRSEHTWREIDRPRGLLPGLPLTLEAGRQQPKRSLVMRIFRLAWVEIGGGRWEWPALRLLPVMQDAGLTRSTTPFLGTRQDISFMKKE